MKKSLQSQLLAISIVVNLLLVAVLVAYFVNNQRISASSSTSDTVAPTVSITYPTGKTNISPNSTVNITAIASDNVGVAQVDIRVSIVTRSKSNTETITPLYNCVDSTAPYVCLWSVPNKTNVTYLIQAVAQDLAGNSGGSKYIQFTVR